MNADNLVNHIICDFTVNVILMKLQLDSPAEFVRMNGSPYLVNLATEKYHVPETEGSRNSERERETEKECGRERDREKLRERQRKKVKGRPSERGTNSVSLVMGLTSLFPVCFLYI